LPETFEFMGQTLSASELLTQTDTAALLVVKDGVIRHEQYTLTGGPHVNWLSMSVAKSFISALVGIALERGLPYTAPGQPVLGSVRLPDGYGYQWWLPAGGRGDFMAIGVYNQYVYVDPASAVTVVKLSANRAYGTAPDMSTNRDGEISAYLAAIAQSLVLGTLENRLFLGQEGPDRVAVVGGRAEPALRGGFSRQRVGERARSPVREKPLRLRVGGRWAGGQGGR
jgi:CubicO group peptidase (beta-lactamase class C family)